jgi:hypothetical protein
MSIMNAQLDTHNGQRVIILTVAIPDELTIAASGNVTLASHNWSDKIGSLGGVNLTGQVILHADNSCLTDALPQPDGDTFNVREAAKAAKGSDNPYKGATLTDEHFRDGWSEYLTEKCTNGLSTLDAPISKAKPGKAKSQPKALPVAAQ